MLVPVRSIRESNWIFLFVVEYCRLYEDKCNRAENRFAMSTLALYMITAGTAAAAAVGHPYVL